MRQPALMIRLKERGAGRHAELGLVVGLVAISLVRAFLRLGYGISLDDEAYYLSLPLRFALGDRPFVQDWTPVQISGFFLAGPIRLFLLLRHSTDGLVWFTRFLYFLFGSTVALLFFKALEKDLAKRSLALIAILFVVWIPYGFPNFTYLALAPYLVMLGGLACAKGGGRPIVLSMAGACYVGAVIAFPPYLVLFLLALGMLAIEPGAERRRRLFALLSGVLVAGVVFLNWCGGVGPLWHGFLIGTIVDSARFHRLSQGSVIATLLDYFLTRRLWVALLVASISELVLRHTSGQRWRSVRPWIPAAVAASALLLTHPRFGGYGRDAYVLNLAFVALLAYAQFPLSSSNRTLFWWVAIPSAIGGLIMASTCTTVFWSWSAGGFPCAVYAVFFGARWAQGQTVSSDRPSRMALISFLMVNLLAFLSFQRLGLEETVPSVFALDQRPSSGPFRGIATDRYKRDLLENLQRDLQPYMAQTKRILFYPKFAAGYLLFPVPPGAWFLFETYCPTPLFDKCSDYLRSSATRPDLSVQVNLVDFGLHVTWGATPKFQAMIDESFQPILSRSQYRIFQHR